MLHVNNKRNARSWHTQPTAPAHGAPATLQSHLSCLLPPRSQPSTKLQLACFCSCSGRGRHCLVVAHVSQPPFGLEHTFPPRTRRCCGWCSCRSFFCLARHSAGRSIERGHSDDATLCHVATEREVGSTAAGCQQIESCTRVFVCFPPFRELPRWRSSWVPGCKKVDTWR